MFWRACFKAKENLVIFVFHLQSNEGEPLGSPEGLVQEGDLQTSQLCFIMGSGSKQDITKVIYSFPRPLNATLCSQFPSHLGQRAKGLMPRRIIAFFRSAMDGPFSRYNTRSKGKFISPRATSALTRDSSPSQILSSHSRLRGLQPHHSTIYTGLPA